LLEVARRDSLTQIESRGSLLELLDRELSRARRAGDAFSLLFIDVDHFKAVNDAYGHAAGDEMLRNLVEMVQRSLRPGDIVGRYGGDEFLVGLVRTGEDTARGIAERVCKTAIASTHGGKPLTVSIGCATLTRDDSLADLIGRADSAMYEAKANGRNRVCLQVLRPSDGPPPLSSEFAEPRHLRLLLTPACATTD
jgi:diguanylate cyclase